MSLTAWQPTTELAPTAPAPDRDSWVAVIEPVADLASKIANTPFVPAGLRGNVPGIAACILYGREIGLGPMTSLREVDIIEGRPAPRAELQRALVQQQGHEIVIVEQTTTRAIVKGRRRGSAEWSEARYGMDDAKRAGLDGRPNYRKNPADMLLARASARLCRTVFADAVLGMPYVSEEISDGDLMASAPAPAPVENAAPVRTAQRATRQRPAKPTRSQPPAEQVEAPSEPDFEPTPDSSPPADNDVPDSLTLATDAISKAQLGKLGAMFREAEITDRDERIALVVSIIDRDVESSNELTKREASRVIDELPGRVAGLSAPTGADGGSTE